MNSLTKLTTIKDGFSYAGSLPIPEIGYSERYEFRRYIHFVIINKSWEWLEAVGTVRDKKKG